MAAIVRAIGPADETVLLHRPYLPPQAWDYIKSCLDTGWVSSAGSFVTKFEELLADATGAKRAVATVNGTAALEICLRLVGVQPDTEVICPSLTFVATANAIAHCGAQPHFVDASDERLSICPESLSLRLEEILKPGAEGPINRQTGRRISAVCLMHCFGHPGKLDEILEICNRYDLPLVEDAAESLGSTYKGKHTGRFGRVAAFSFNGNKILTTGGGGAIVTDDEQLADRAKHLTTTAKVPHQWEFEHDEIAWNFRMPNLNAALGAAQLEILPALLRAKRELVGQYQDGFSGLRNVSLLSEPADSQSNYWLNCLLLSRDDLETRDAVLRTVNEAGFQCRPLWQPMHSLAMFRDCPRGDLRRTDSLTRRAINIPSSSDLANQWGEICQS